MLSALCPESANDGLCKADFKSVMGVEDRVDCNRARRSYFTSPMTATSSLLSNSDFKVGRPYGSISHDAGNRNIENPLAVGNPPTVSILHP